MRFVVSDFMPALQGLGLANIGVWDTAYGDYPMRLLVFVADTAADMDRALASEEFLEVEEKLKSYVSDYVRRVVPYDARFQF
jgi:hypothetical protein